MTRLTARAAPAVLLAPAFALFAVLTLYPLLRGLALSLVETEYGLAGAEWVGLSNYGYLLGERFFRQAAWNTVYFSVLATISEVSLGLALALLVNRAFPGRRLVIPILVAPFVLSTMVVTAIWRAWFHFEVGFLNSLVRELGLRPVGWLVDPDIAMLSLVLVDLWQTFPITFLIVLAGLQAVPEDVLEAARIDGASPWTSLRTIVLPLIWPHVMLAALLRSIESFKLFDKVYALTGGGPGNATETLSMYVYRLGFRYFDIGLASAAAVVMVVIAGLLAWLYVARVLRGGVQHGD
jgi:multiple sugar transport system permease protein